VTINLNYKIVIPLALVALAGLGFWIYQMSEGLIVTNMRNSFSWGLYTVMWVFFVGAAAGGLVVTSAVYLFKIKGLKPVGRIASITAFICTIAAMVVLLPDLGRADRIYNLIIHPNFNSVLPWDFIVLSTYALLSAIYTYILIRPDIASRGIRLPLLGVVGKKDIGEAALAQMREKSERQARIIAPIALIVAVLIHTVTAWVLATQLGRPWWFGGALAPTFIASAIASGPAVVILASLYTLRFRDQLASAYAVLAKIAVIGAIVLLFIYYNDFVVRAWWGQGAESETLQVLFGTYWPLHLIEVLFIIAGIILFLTQAKKLGGILIGSLSMIIGVMAHRFILLPPAFNVFPFKVPVLGSEGLADWVYPVASGEIRGTLDNPEPLFVSWWNYVPSLVEIVIVAGVIAAVILVYIGLTRTLPVDVEQK